MLQWNFSKCVIRRIIYAKFDPAGVWTIDIWMVYWTFHVTELLILPTEPSMTLKFLPANFEKGDFILLCPN